MGTSPNVENLVEQIGKLTVLELAELAKALESKFGVTAVAPVAVQAVAHPSSDAAAAPAPSQSAAEEKTTFSVVLTAVGEKKLMVIKEFRAISGLGLKEAKEFIEGDMPRLIKENVTKEEANEIKAKLEAVGASVEIK